MRLGVWPVMNDRAARRATVLRVVVGEHHAFAGDAVDVGGSIAHQAERVGTDIGLPDVVTVDDEDVGPCWLLLGLRGRWAEQRSAGDANGSRHSGAIPHVAPTQGT